MTSSIQPRIQRIQDAISQASDSGQGSSYANAAGQSQVCSFEIEGRTQVGYLGVNSIAEVTPPWFPKDAFQVKGRCEKPASPIITLTPTRTPVSEVNPETASDRQVQEAIAKVTGSSHNRPFPSSISVDAFQAVATQDEGFIQAELPLGLAPLPAQPEETALMAPEGSKSVTAEILADLFEQAAPLPQPPAAEPGSGSHGPALLADESEQQPHKALVAPVSPAEQAAAQALAQSLSQAPAESLTQPSQDEAEPSPEPIKPIAAVTPPALPRSKSPEISSHHNSTNPMLPLELLQNIGQEVIVWQEALKEVHHKIQTLYQEGPILNGWLEKHAEAGVYLLCGLEPTGQSWRRPCHPDQLQPVGLAIGRYKKLRLLLGEKQHLDQRIKRLSETLTMLRLRLRAY